MDVLKTITDFEVIKVMADPMRLRILGVLQDKGSASATDIGSEIEESASKVSYHLKLLEKHSIVQLVETRTKGNLIENVYAPTARRFEIRHDIASATRDGENSAEAMQFMQEAIRLISGDLLELTKLNREKHYDSTISYDTYYLTLREIEELRQDIMTRLRSLEGRRSDGEVLACKIGFLLLDTTQEH